MRTGPHYPPNDRLKAPGAAIAYAFAVDNRKTVIEMLGEFLREAAVLAAVFIPLDRVMMGDALTFGWVVSILGITGGLLAAGMTAERMRKR